MDPNEQDADQKIIEASDKEAEALELREQGAQNQASEMEEEVASEKEQAEQQKMDTESLINQDKAAHRPA